MFGDFVIADERHGIRVEHGTSRLSTSGTVIFTVEGQDRRYLHCIGANADFTLEDVDDSLLDNVRVLYVGGYLAMPGFAPAQLARLLAEAHRRHDGARRGHGRAVALGFEHVAGALPYTDYFLPNQDEAARLFRSAGPGGTPSSANPDCAVVITRGPHGALTKRGGRTIETPPFRMDTVDESGAGDAFTAGLITGLLENWDLERTLSFAAGGVPARARSAALAGIFTFDEATSFLTEQAAAVSRMKH